MSKVSKKKFARYLNSALDHFSVYVTNSSNRTISKWLANMESPVVSKTPYHLSLVHMQVLVISEESQSIFPMNFVSKRDK